ncbi:MAG: hypothetical protein ACRC20_16760 [Segniliparus sp.]|uniref:hypothetical protein n=1 Tax=Segniliparus sp. TaxID=2804064 RepID=UPI003F33CD37
MPLAGVPPCDTSGELVLVQVVEHILQAAHHFERRSAASPGAPRLQRAPNGMAARALPRWALWPLPQWRGCAPPRLQAFPEFSRARQM